MCPYRTPGRITGHGPVRRFGGADAGTVPTLMRQYKSVVTRGIRAVYGADAVPVWQRGYHDRIVRTERHAAHVRRYIADHPARWVTGPPRLEPPGR